MVADVIADISEMSPEEARMPDVISIPDTGPEIITDFPELPLAPGVVLEWQSDNPGTPYPWNFYLLDDADSRTGKRISVSGPNRIPVVLASGLDMFSQVQQDLERMDGFGSMGSILVPVSHALDPDTIPVATGPESVLDVIWIGEQTTSSAPFEVDYRVCNDGDGPFALKLSPRVAMVENSRYLVVVRDGLKSADGSPLAPYPMSEVLIGSRAPYGPDAFRTRLAVEAEVTQEALAQAGQESQALVAAFLVDTGIMESDLFAGAAAIDGVEFEINLDPDGDGIDNVYLPGEHSKIAVNGPAAALVLGEFKAPLFQDEDGIIEPDSDGAILPQSYYWRPFWFYWPKEPESESVRIAYIQHGLNSSKETMMSMGRDVNARGLASAGFAFIHHAEGEGAGGFDFVIIEKMAVTRDNFRQSALDYYSFTRFMETFVDAMPGKPEQLTGVDFSEVIFTGHSLGAVESCMVAALYPGEALVSLLNPGADLSYLMIGFLKETGLIDFAPCDMLLGTEATASQLMSAMDTAVMAPYVQAAPLPGYAPKEYLLEIAMQDGTMYPETGYALARALQSPLITPCIDCWPYLNQLESSMTHSGTVQIEGGHNHFYGGPTKEMARNLYYHYLDTWLETGTPEILWPIE